MTFDPLGEKYAEFGRRGGLFGVLSRVVPREFCQRGTVRRAGFVGLSLVSPVSPVNSSCAYAWACIAHDNLHRTLGTHRTKNIRS